MKAKKVVGLFLAVILVLDTLKISTTYANVVSSDATLDNLAISTSSLIPEFDSATTEYAVYVTNDTTSIEITPTTSDSNATVSIEGVNTTGQAIEISLAVGSNEINIITTAEDMITSSETIVTVTRLEAEVSTINTVVGTTLIGDGGLAEEAKLDNPRDVITDSDGNIYVADSGNHRIRKIDANGIITTIAGTGNNGYSGDGGLAVNAEMFNPRGMALDSSGNLYVADSRNHVIRKIDTSGYITTVAGTGSSDGDVQNNILATSAILDDPADVQIVDENIYIADNGNHMIRKIDASGIITTIAGTGEQDYSGDGGLATSAKLNNPQAIDMDGEGNLYINDTDNNCIRKVDSDGKISTIIDDLNEPMGLILDSDGNIYFSNTNDHQILKYTTSSGISIIAGTGTQGFSGDNGLAVNAEFDNPYGIYMDNDGNIYIADQANNRIRKMNTSGNVSTIAGRNNDYYGDGGLAVNAELNRPYYVVLDSIGNMYISDTHNNVIRKVDTSGTISTIAGTGTGAYSGDGGLAIESELNFPKGLIVDSDQNIYIADYSNNRIRKIDTNGYISTIAGTGNRNYSGDGGLAIEAELNQPHDIAFDNSGNLYIADSYNYVVRKIDTSGYITTVAGTGTSDYSGDGGLAIEAELDSPSSVTVDSLGNIYIVDSDSDVIRKVDTEGIIDTVVGNGNDGYTGDGKLATLAELDNPYDVTVDSIGNLYFSDAGNSVIRKVDTSGIISTIAGTSNRGYSGDGVPAIMAELNYPYGLAIDSNRNIYIADSQNDFIRKITVTSLTGDVTITGNPVYGEEVTASLNNSNNTGTLYYQWLRNGSEISGAISSTYTIVQDDVGNQIAVNILSDAETGTLTSDSTEVEKAECETLTVITPVLDNKTTNTVTLEVVADYEYIIVDNEADTSTGTWQDSNVFTGLIANTDYDCYQRVKETTTHKASTTSAALELTTNSETTSNDETSNEEINNDESSSDESTDIIIEALTGEVTITGNPVYGEELIVSLNNSNNTGTLFYQWLRNGSEISGATSATYTIVQDDVGNQIAVNILSDVETGTLTSDSTEVEKAECETLTVITPVLDNKTTNTVTLEVVADYEYIIVDNEADTSTGTWQDSNVFTGLIANTDYDCYQRVKETTTHKASTTSAALELTTNSEATNNDETSSEETNNDETSSEESTDIIIEALTGEVTITGNPVYGEELIVSLNNSNNTGTLFYQWLRNGSEISGATSATYTIVQDDVGNQIAVNILSDVETGTLTSDTIEVEKAECETLTVITPVLDNKTTNTVTLEVVADYEYIIVDNEADTSTGTWQDSNVFTGLIANTDYDCYQRVKETTTHKASTTSAALEVTTNSEATNNDETSSEETNNDETSSEETNNDETSSEETNNDETNNDETSSDEASSEEASSDETGSEETISEETSSDETTDVIESTSETKTNSDGSLTLILEITEIDEETEQAIVELSSQEIESAFEQVTKDEDSKKKVEIEISIEEGTNGYQIELPTSALISNSDREIVIKTDFGLVVLQGNMLSNKILANSDKISLSVKIADKTKLPLELQEKIGDRPVLELELIEDGQQIDWENGKAPVNISVPYVPTEKELENPERIAVWYIDEEGEVTIVKSGSYNIETGMINFKVTHFSIYAIVFDDVTFNDLENYLWAKHQIEILAVKGITNGTGNDEFSPQNNITRAEFLTLLIRTLELEEEFDKNFDDIKKSQYYYEAVGIAKELGITTGIGNNKFNGEGYITREDMMVMTEKALMIKGSLTNEIDQSILDSFSDKEQISTYAVNSISSLVSNGLITGSNNELNPKGYTTRAESAVLIYRLYNLEVASE